MLVGALVLGLWSGSPLPLITLAGSVLMGQAYLAASCSWMISSSMHPMLYQGMTPDPACKGLLAVAPWPGS